MVPRNCEHNTLAAVSPHYNHIGNSSRQTEIHVGEVFLLTARDFPGEWDVLAWGALSCYTPPPTQHSLSSDRFAVVPLYGATAPLYVVLSYDKTFSMLVIIIIFFKIWNTNNASQYQVISYSFKRISLNVWTYIFLYTSTGSGNIPKLTTAKVSFCWIIIIVIFIMISIPTFNATFYIFCCFFSYFLF